MGIINFLGNNLALCILFLFSIIVLGIGLISFSWYSYYRYTWSELLSSDARIQRLYYAVLGKYPFSSERDEQKYSHGNHKNNTTVRLMEIDFAISEIEKYLMEKGMEGHFESTHLGAVQRKETSH